MGHFFSEMLCSWLYNYSEPYYSLVSYFEVWPVMHLVKAEIVSPYYGILINTGMGNPTAPLITVLGDKQILSGWWGHIIAYAHIRG